MYTITDERYNEIIDYFKGYYSVILTKDMIDNLMEHDSEMREEFFHNSYTDTCQREYIIDYFAVKVVGKHWPLNGDGQEYFNSFIKEAIEKGLIDKNA